MGSGKPKRTDRPIINTPRTSGRGGGEGGGRPEVDLNTVCVEEFHVELKQNPLLKKGQSLTINDKGDVLLSGSRVVGKLTAMQYRRLEQCREHGYRYRGTVAQDKRNRLYGRFERYTA